ncbi:hypothetical protein L0F63_004147, partial [Massospora cicadina]
PYFMPLMEDIFSMISKGKFKMDLNDTFHKILILPKHQYYTAFKCQLGVYDYKGDLAIDNSNLTQALQIKAEYKGFS